MNLDKNKNLRMMGECITMSEKKNKERRRKERAKKEEPKVNKISDVKMAYHVWKKGVCHTNSNSHNIRCYYMGNCA